VTSEIAGLVRTLYFRSGDDVRNGQLLVPLNADTDIAQLNSLKAAADLAETVYERDKAQYAAEAVSKAVLDADAADLKSKRALVAQQQAAVDKKAISSPFSGRLGITTVNPGQYVNPGDKIVTLQTIDPIYIDFYLPQQQLARLAVGLPVTLASDSYPERKFTGRIVAFDPKVDLDTRNVQVEALIANPTKQLLPGTSASVSVASGAAQRLLTLPQTAVTFNPYGATVFIVQQTGKTPDGKPILTVKQNFVTTGDTRGDQVAVLSGIKAGEVVVTSGQLKLKNGSEVVINNRIQPSNNAAPKPVDE
jgi:membrane fusion protein (multidrug efflux system)